MSKVDWASLLAAEGTTVVLVDHEGEAQEYRRHIVEQQQGAYLENLRVLPKAQWWVELWDNSFPVKQVLRPVQLLVLAEQCVDNSSFLADSVIGVQGIAQRFVDAFEIAEHYDLSDSLAAMASTEQQAFLHWRAELRQKLETQGALSAGQLPTALQMHLDHLELPARLLLSQSLEFSPPERQLLSSMQSRGVEQQSLPPFASQEEIQACQQFLAQDVAEEVNAAARWAAEQLQLAGDSSASLRLALVAPDMRSYEPVLRRALERHVYPAALFPKQAFPGRAEEELSEPWRVGSGRLVGYPVIAAALDVLLVTGERVPLELLSRLLRSPFIADATVQAGARAQLDWLWREQLQSQTNLRQALREAEYRELDDAVVPLRALQEHVDDTRALPSQWVQRFDGELLAVGWPNREAGDSVVDQCRQGFSQVMDTLRALDRQLGVIQRSEALRWLQHILNGKRFELRRDEAPPIQLLDLEEASRQHFDALWIMGLSDTALPLAVQPSPFLSRDVLLAAGVPRADYADSLDRDRTLLNGLLRSAGTCVVSTPAQNIEGVMQSGCTMLAWTGPQLELPDTEPAFNLKAGYVLPESETVPAVSVSERQRLRGGTGVFKAYAISPFYAFVKYRLGVQAFPQPVEGLDAREQGAWIHRALELFWAEVTDSATLNELSSDSLQAHIEKSINAAMRDSGRYGDELKRLEKRRIQTLLEEWLAFEKSRGEAFEVVATEVRGSVDAFGIPLHIQMDRVDLIDGKRVVLDYKTGTVAANTLNAEKLQEPQLPIYALLGQHLAGGEIDGVVLAQIHARDGMKVHMRSSWTDNLADQKPGKNAVDSPEKWQAECEAWTKVLRHYATGFLAGDAEHDYRLAAKDFPYDPYLTALARAEVIADD